MVGKSEDHIESIVSSLEANGVAAAPIEQSLDLARSQPVAVFRLATEVMERFPKGGTFLDAALTYLPDELWERLVTEALDCLEKSERNDAADSVIAYGSMMSPKSLHSELDRIFKLQPNSGSYYEFYPWRESGTQHFGFLRQMLGESSLESKRRAWRAMLQTRDPEVVDFTASQFNSVFGPEFDGWNPDELRDTHLGIVGISLRTGSLTNTCPDGLYHLGFDDQFFEDDPPPWLQRIHPTWNLPSTENETTIGGSSPSKCSACGGPLHRLIKLESVPADLGVTGLSGLDLATCLSCLGWEVEEMFFKHDMNGQPQGFGYDGAAVSPEFPVGPLKKASCDMSRTPTKWRWQDWGLSNSRENLNRVGGEPSWVQDAQYPDCPGCSSRMNFLMQLDSELPTADGESWMWGSGGIGYGFWCDGCKVSGFLWQCT